MKSSAVFIDDNPGSEKQLKLLIRKYLTDLPIDPCLYKNFLNSLNCLILHQLVMKIEKEKNVYWWRVRRDIKKNTINENDYWRE